MSGSSELPAAATWGRLQTFLAVYETGSVRAAADLLQVTPPAVSAAIAALETALGTVLVGRSGRGIVITDSGETFARYVRKLLGLLAEATAAVRSADRGRIRIGAVATASEYVLPQLMASFVRAHPQLELSLTVLPRAELFAMAADHQIDVVLAGRPPRGSGLVSRAGRDNRLIVVGRLPDHASGLDRDPLTATWLLTGVGSGTRDTTLSLLSRLQAAPPTLTLGTSGAAVAAARQGLGVTLVHEEAVREQLAAGELQSVPVPGTPLARPWRLCTGAEPTAATWLFLRHVCDPTQVGSAAFRPSRRPRVNEPKVSAPDVATTEVATAEARPTR